jgi:hypothetical protein
MKIYDKNPMTHEMSIILTILTHIIQLCYVYAVLYIIRLRATCLVNIVMIVLYSENIQFSPKKIHLSMFCVYTIMFLYVRYDLYYRMF